MSLPSIDAKLQRLLDYQIGPVPIQTEEGNTNYKIETLDMTSTFTDTKVNIEGFNLILLRSDGNSTSINYKITSNNASTTKSINLDDMHQLVGFSRSLLITNAVAESGKSLFIIKIQVPSTMISAFASQRDLERYMSDLNADGISNNQTNALPTGGGSMTLQGPSGTWNRLRGTHNETVLSSAARTSTTTSSDFTNFNSTRLTVYLNVTVAPGVETLNLALQGKDPISGSYGSLAATGTQDATGLFEIGLGPGVTDARGELTNKNDVPLPRKWRIVVTHSASGSFTYSVAVTEGA